MLWNYDNWFVYVNKPIIVISNSFQSLLDGNVAAKDPKGGKGKSNST